MSTDKFPAGVHPGPKPGNMPPSEAAIYDKMAEALPRGWSAWFSLKIGPVKGGSVGCDLVIADPEKGLVVFEVRNGVVEKKGADWLQNGRPAAPPLQNAHYFKKCLTDVFEARGLSGPPIGVAVIFPDMYVSDLPALGEIAGVIIHGRELQNLKDMLPDMFRTALPKNITHPPGPGWPQAVHELWSECWPFESSLSRKVAEEDKRRFGLEKDQMDVLGGLPESRLAVVKGGAGSGKTLIAMQLALRERAAGRSTLMITHTPALARELARRTAGSGLEVRTADELKMEYFGRRVRGEEDDPIPGLRIKVFKKAAGPKMIRKPDRKDLIIVDEGQDMARDEWDLVGKLTREGTKLWVLFDPGQILLKDRDLPETIAEKAAVFILPGRHRCRPGVQALALAYIGEPADEEAAAGAFNDRTIEAIAVPGREFIRTAAEHEIRRLLADGSRPEDIAVLSLRDPDQDGVSGGGPLGGTRTVRAAESDLETSLVCDSFLNFKGLERPAVIIVEPDPALENYGVRMNIALTRSSGIVRMIGEQESMSRDPLLSRPPGAGAAG